MTDAAHNLGCVPAGAASDIAVVDHRSNAEFRAISYAELDAAIDRRLTDLHTQNMRPGERIGILGLNSLEFLVALFAIMRGGGVAVPINVKLTDETIDYIVDDADIARAFADTDSATRLPAGIESWSLTPEADFTAAPGERKTPIGANDDPALVLYTSGSTGRPKGVLLSHASQLFMIDALGPGLIGAIGAVAAPLYHMNGMLMSFLLLNGGGRLVLMPRFDARTYLEATARHTADTITGVPTMLSLMAREHAQGFRLDLNHVANVLIGSSPLSESIISEARSMFPNACVANSYGTTETGTGMFGPHPDGLATPPMSLGFPNPATEVRLRGARPDQGVLEIRSPAAMTRYLNLPKKTREKHTDDGFIVTGDIMRRDAAGFFYFVGRNDDMFVCGGENVYPGEVERVLERDTRILEACVVPVNDPVRGKKPVAFVTTAPGAAIDESAVKEIALAGAPAYMHPRAVFIVDSMPLAGTNKVDRKLLAERAARETAAG